MICEASRTLRDAQSSSVDCLNSRQDASSPYTMKADALNIPCDSVEYHGNGRLKTLGGLTPYEYICKIWTSEPESINPDPIHQMPGLNT